MNPYAEAEPQTATPSLNDLFGNTRFLEKKGKPLSERAGLVKFFVDHMGREPRFWGYRLHPFTVSDLYALQSGFKDRLRRPCHLCQDHMSGSCEHSGETARKWLWWATRSEKEV